MKKYIALSLMLIITCVSSGQEKPTMDDTPRQPSYWLKEGWLAAESNYVDTFADAFKDPNIVIGVFDYPERFPHDITLSSGEKLFEIPGFWEALPRFTALICVKTIKGKFTEPVIFVYTFPLIYRTLYERPPIPWFRPPRGSKWVLALERTSQEYRVARFGDKIEKYKFINDNTLFMPFRYGRGTLCLKWPEKDKKFPEPLYLVKVPESIVDDSEAIQRVMPYIQKEKVDPSEMTAINNTSKALKTDVAKSIFAKILADRSQKTQDPNDR